jgi:ABC-type branched-subunit amino acid transport system permease subunit
VFLPIYSEKPPIFSFDFADQAPSVVFGVVLIVIMVLLPGGIAGLVKRLSALVRGGWAARRTSQPGA